ncbi:MAG: GMC family oxidoreductase [Bdellovibrionales bacterium]|nr:GMC family oxidoreductase [Bdellovibrionales bacterium]
MPQTPAYDVVVIGSGVAGGRMAMDLAVSGARVCVLEAGPAYDRKTFPKGEMAYSSRMFWGGGIEMTSDGRLGLLRAKCLGGTSIVNQALLDRFDDVAWDEWADISSVRFFNRAEMTPVYEQVEKDVSIQYLPEKARNRNAQIFTKAFDELNYHYKPLRRGQSDCALEQGSDCIVCLGGCPRDSKQSSLVTSIRRAREKGAVIEAGFEVHSVDDSGAEVRVKGRQNGKDAEVRGRRVVLASGALGNTGILMRSGYGKGLPALGKRFACHPQFMTYAAFKEPVNAHKGAFQTVASDDPKLRRAGYKYENVYAPPIGTAMLLPGLGRAHLERMKKYRYLASMEIAVRDEAVGSLSLMKDGRVAVSKPLTDQDTRRLRQGIALVHELYEAAGAAEVIRCDQGFGLHLMGGCGIGVDERQAVVSPDFQVYGHPKLYAADSSIFPSAPGINPSLTILALAHLAAVKMAKQA